MYYNPANHLVFAIHTQKDKTYKTVDKFINYLNELNKSKQSDQNDSEFDVYLISTDQGVEFQKKFEEQLDSYDIQHFQFPAPIDHLALAHINRMSRYLRDFVLRQIDQNEYETSQQVQDNIDDILNKFNHYQNFEHKIVEYKKPPIEITEEEVQDRNQKIRLENQLKNEGKATDQLYQFQIGDIVQLRLKRETFEKHRYDKYSKGNYKIINKLKHYYLCIPMNFDKQQFKDEMKRREFEIPKVFQYPVYFRKGFEMKLIDKPTDKYYQRELENTTFMSFKRILQAKLRNDNNTFSSVYDLATFTSRPYEERYYEIEINSKVSDQKQQVETMLIQQRQLRQNRLEMNEAEKVFWFDSNKDPNSLFCYNIRN